MNLRITLALALFSTASALPASGQVPRVPQPIQELMQQRQYEAAVKAIDGVNNADKVDLDYLAYLRGRALHLQEKYDEAIAAYRAVEQEHADSPYARQARFAAALSHVRKGDFRTAEKIYREEARYLLSLNRKQELADIYLEFADAYFKPPKQQQKPDYQKALEFYQQALELGPQPEQRREVELLIGQCLQKLGQLDQAIAHFNEFVDEHLDDPLVIEARYRLGETQLQKKDNVAARRTWQDLLELHGEDPSPRVAEAMFNLSVTYGIPTPADAENLSLGVAALQRFLAKYPKHKLASTAHLRIAQSYQNRGRFEDSVASLTKFLEDEAYADRAEIPDARFLLGNAYKMQRKFDNALNVWQDYLQKHPTHKLWSKVQQEIIDTEYLKALNLYNEKKTEPARTLLSEFLAKYPLDARCRSILYLFGQMQFDAKKWNAAISDWEKLVSKYPQSEEASRAQYMIAATLEEQLKKLDQALEQYRKVTWGRFQNAAQQRISRLTAKSLKVVTERVFRTDETPRLRLETRNIEAVKVQVYQVDLETYFRKMHLAVGIEKLDIALIDPDHSFEYKIPGYSAYQQFTQQVEVPLPTSQDAGPAAGVMAVTVSSKTLESTTLIVRSDLDVIAKSSRDEIFLFVQNMRTGEPCPQAQVLVSNGDQVFADGETNDDGIYRHTYEQLKSANDVRVFVVADEHVAFNNVGLDGIGVAQGLTDKGYIFTDRPAYRPGQMVHVRGILRKADKDVYTIATGKKYQVSVYDNRSRLVHETEVELSDLGSFHANFPLPAACPQGEYRILVQDVDKENYQGSFVVHDYQLEPVRIEVTSPRTVYYRGEELEGKIKVSYYYGAPLAEREVRYQLAGGRMYTAKTDQDGQIEFNLPTRDFRESQPLPLVVFLPERNLQAGKTFYLATQAFTLSAATVRDVFLAGETFELKVDAKDAEGEPLAVPLELRVLKRTTVAGRTGEVSVQQHVIKTDEEGTARHTLKLADGGQYVLRAEGTDRFGNPVSSENVVTISDEKDAVRLRILSSKHTYRVGDTASVQVHWREDPATALVTYQGARILEYRLVQLNQGANKLEIPMAAVLAPNFDLAVAVMTDVRDKKRNGEPARRFHEASSPFTVQRQLNVIVDWEGKGRESTRHQPGDKLDVTIKTTDPQGKPVSAEVSLAMIERALLDQFPTSVSAVQKFFRNVPRQSMMRTVSSITFDYKPSTKAINPRLLAEADRLAIAEEETRRLTALAASNESLDLRERFLAESSAPVTGGTILSYESGAATNYDTGRPATAWGGSQSGVNNWSALQSRRQSLQRQQTANLADFAQIDQTLGAQLPQLNYQSPQSPPVDSFFYAIPNRDQRWRNVELQWADGNFDAQAGEFGYQVLTKNGTLFNVTLDHKNRAEHDQLAQALIEQGAIVIPQMRPDETGYWNPAIRTDERGVAKVSITLPNRSTAWTLAAKGITADTLAGEAKESLKCQKDLFGQLKLPAALTDNDTAELQATIHNDLLDKGEVTVELRTTIGGKSVSERKTVQFEKKGIQEVSFTQTLRLPEADRITGAPEVEAVFELVVQSGDVRDTVRRSVPIRPYGTPVYAIKGGSADSDVTSVVEAPPEMPLTAPRLQVIVGPTVQRSLVDVLFASPTWCQRYANRITASSDATVSDLLAALALQGLLGKTREASSPETEDIDRRIRSAISLLISTQNDDGGWSWSGRAGISDRYYSSRVVWALSLARRSGYSVADKGYSTALDFLRNQLAAAAVTDYESKSVLLHALAVAKRGDFPLANQLYRNRQSLSPAALCHLALAFAEMDRRQTASELLAMLTNRNLDEPPPRAKWLSWNQSATELHALYAVALEKTVPRDNRLREQIDWLMAHRTGHRWSPDKATGPAMLALCRWFAETRHEGEKYKLAIYVNDKLAGELDVDKETGTQTIEVPTELLADGKQSIRFQLTGRGQFTYQCVLGGFVAADQLKSTTADWTVVRYCEPANLEVDGKTIPRGFTVLQGSYRSFRNELKQLPVGRRGHVELVVRRHHVPVNTRQEQLEYLVVTEPLPAGVTVVEGSVKGGFERFEITPGAILFYIGTRPSLAPIHYEVHGYLPGQYQVAPTMVRNVYRPDQIAVSKPQGMTVLPLGAASADKYRLTPVELFELGKWHFEKHDFQTAARYLGQLSSEWNLKSDPFRETVRMLLDVHLEMGPASQVVRFFEIIVEKYPDLEIPFAKLLKVGDAYDEIGEYERSYLVFRAAVEASFMRESRVAGFLQQQQEFLRSVDVMQELLREYPPESYVASASYALAQEVYAKAETASQDAKLRERKITRVDLIRQAWAMLDVFLTANPNDPAADEASFSLANAILDLEQYEETIRRCNQFAERFPKSEFLDSFWYIIGYCHFARGEHEQALDMCRKVAAAQRVDKTTGRKTESPNKWRAVYILGQIYHSLGQAQQAIEQYRRVAQRFVDARQAIEYFTRKDIALPEVTHVEPGDDVRVELKYRNVANCITTVYRIDLMKFSLLRRNLGGITQINLAGIQPFHQTEVELGDGKDFRDQTTDLELPLKDEGAYLVVCRGDNLHASGLVLISPLTLEIQEETKSGRVRATVRDTVQDNYVNAVHVKVIGTRNDDFVSGETDLRGIFVADGINGQSMVIAEADGGRYAFFRGSQDLGEPPAPAQQAEQAGQGEGQQADAEPQATGKGQLLEGLKGGNRAIQLRNQKALEDLYENPVDSGIGGGFGGGIF